MGKKQIKSLHSIRKVKRRVEHKLLQKTGVKRVGVGVKVTDGQPTGEIVITAFVVKKRDDIPVKERIPRQIYGIKTDVIESSEGYVIPQADELPECQVHYNPLIGGACVGPARRFENNGIMRGTLGAIVIDARNGQPGILSNFHTLAVTNDWPQADTTILQPPQGASRIVAHLTQAVLLENEGVDAAVANIDTSVGLAHAIAEIGPTNGSTFAKPYTRVRKRGVATGLTHGIIHHMDITPGVQVDYTKFGLGVKTLSNQIAIVADPPNTTFSADGDSGSAIVDDAGRVVGLLVGPDGQFYYANHIENVLNNLHIKIP